jgi:DNA-binding transcriptional LysR family regulator
LFHRDPAGIRLTAAGQALLDPANEALVVVADGIRAARDAARMDVEVLRIGVPYASALGELQQPILSAYAEVSPRTHLVFRSMDPGELYNGLSDNTIDISLTRLPLDPSRALGPNYSKTRLSLVSSRGIRSSRRI